MDQVVTTGNPTSAVLSIPELAKLLDMNVKHCYALAKRNELPEPIQVRRVGRRLIVPKYGVRRFLGLDGDEE